MFSRPGCVSTLHLGGGTPSRARTALEARYLPQGPDAFDKGLRQALEYQSTIKMLIQPILACATDDDGSHDVAPTLAEHPASGS